MKIIKNLLDLISNRTEKRYKKKMEKVLKGEKLKDLIKENKNILKLTEKESINITLTPQTNTAPTTSKLGGIPYLPSNKTYPINKKTGKPLHFIAQINFKEVPQLNPFPNKGILQFFIGSLWEKDYHEIRYYETISNIDKKNTDIPELKLLDSEESPVLKESKMTFNRQIEYVSMDDFRYEQFLDKDLREKLGFDTTEIKKVSDLDLSGIGSKLGGYAFSTQGYHRYNKSTQQYDTVLLQLDSDKDEFIMWGDSGVGAFFIQETDLKKSNFKDTYFSWNCY